VAITKEERRFLRYWEEQRNGSKIGYYIMYITIWFFTALLCLFFVSNNFVTFGSTSINVLYIIMAIALAIAVLGTHFTFNRNQKKFKKIINREIESNEATKL
jgi:Flp pilus assembly protein TadB